MCCNWCEAFCESQWSSGESEGKGTELVSGALEVETEVSVMTWMDGNVKIYILKVYYHKPVSLEEERDDGIESDHPEAFGLGVCVEMTEIEDGMASISLWNCEVPVIETCVKILVGNSEDSLLLEDERDFI